MNKVDAQSEMLFDELEKNMKLALKSVRRLTRKNKSIDLAETYLLMARENFIALRNRLDPDSV